MNNEIKSIFANTIGTISYLIVIFFFVTLILFMHNDVENAVKEAWIASIYFLSVLSTLGAAYIASRLFNDWRDQFKFQLLKEKIDLANEIINRISEDDLYVLTDRKFKDLASLRNSFYKLYETVIIIDLKNNDLQDYKKLHLEVAEIIISLLIDGNRPLNSQEIKKVMYYRGEIWKLKTLFVNHINEALNQS